MTLPTRFFSKGTSSSATNGLLQQEHRLLKVLPVLLRGPASITGTETQRVSVLPSHLAQSKAAVSRRNMH